MFCSRVLKFISTSVLMLALIGCDSQTDQKPPPAQEKQPVVEQELKTEPAIFKNIKSISGRLFTAKLEKVLITDKDIIKEITNELLKAEVIHHRKLRFNGFIRGPLFAGVIYYNTKTPATFTIGADGSVLIECYEKHREDLFGHFKSTENVSVEKLTALFEKCVVEPDQSKDGGAGGATEGLKDEGTAGKQDQKADTQNAKRTKEPNQPKPQIGYHWHPKSILKKAELLVVGEVYEITEPTPIAKEATHWKIPLLQMNAKIRVKRFFVISDKHEIKEAESITIAYYAVDWANLKRPVYTPIFREFSPGDVFVFPLKKALPQQNNPWELISEEGFDLLFPAVTEQLQESSKVKTGDEFLCTEIAGAFSKGKYETIFKAARYLGHVFAWAEEFEETYKLIEKHVGDDEERWLNITTACYSVMGIPRPKIVDLHLWKDKEHRLAGALAARTLGHVNKHDLDERLIAKSITHCNTHAWGTAVTICNNYSRHPTAMRLLRKALEDPTPGAVYVAGYIIKEKGHPLSAVAVDAAVKILKQLGPMEYSGLRTACGLIRDYGDEKAFAFLVEDIRKSQKTDRERYKSLWRTSADTSTKNQRFIEICRIAINDSASCSYTLRFCDLAAFALQRVTGEDFGMAGKQTPAEREKAIQKAKDYLEEWETKKKKDK